MLILLISIGFITLTSTEVIHCNFQVKQWDEYVINPYTCVTKNIAYSTVISVEKINGKHVQKFNNKNVKALEISNQRCEYFPIGFENFFTNLEGLGVVDSKLKIIRKKDLEAFPLLKSLYLTGNFMKTLEYSLLINNQQIKKISFARNQLIGIGDDILNNLENLEEVDLTRANCLDIKAVNKDEIESIKAQLVKKCPATENMKYIRDIDVKCYLCQQEQKDARQYEEQNQRLREENEQLMNKYKQKEIECSMSILLESQKCEKERSEIQSKFDEESVKLQNCTNDLIASRDILATTLKPVMGPLCDSDHYVYNVLIECDVFYNTTCISKSTLVPFEGMKVVGVVLPDGMKLNEGLITEIHISGSSIRDIPNNFGEFFSNLQILKIDSVRVEKINIYSFSGLKSLQEFSFTNSKLDKIHDEAFISLTNLVSLDLSGNKLTEIGKVIETLTSLQIIKFDRNQITTIEWKVFNNIKNIKIISFTSNPLQYIDASFLNTQIFTNLVSVDLTGTKCVNSKYPDNSLQEISEVLTKNCPFEVQLQCEFKEVEKDYICEAKSLEVYYENTVITSIVGIHPNSASSVLDVTKIVINNQTMHYIPLSLFEQFGKNVKKFVVDSTGLKKITHLVGLREVTITNTDVTVIDGNCFIGSPEIEYIYLPGNKITHITEEAFKSTRKVIEFDISYNKFTTFTSSSIETILASSSRVVLSGNKISTFVYTYAGSNKPQIFLENNPCIDRKFGTDTEVLIQELQDKCSEKVELSCEFKTIDQDYVCIARNFSITSENTKLTGVNGNHRESSLSILNITKIIIENQNMEYFPNNIHKLFESLEKVQVISSNLKKITKTIGKNLTWVKIAGNHIIKIDENSFDESPSLEYVDISNNEISFIPEYLFQNNYYITDINLSYNKLVTIKWSIFSFCTVLQSINLSHNKLKRIDWSQLSIDVENVDLTGNECINLKYSVDESENFMETINYNCGSETTLTCKFLKSGSDYICSTINLEILNENTRVTEIQGNHLPGKSNKDVTKFISRNQKVVYFPINIRKFFTKLKIADIKSQTFNLIVIFISDTEIMKLSK